VDISPCFDLAWFMHQTTGSANFLLMITQRSSLYIRLARSFRHCAGVVISVQLK